MEDFCKSNPELCEFLPKQEQRYLLDANAFDFQKKYRIDVRNFSPELKQAMNVTLPENKKYKDLYIANKTPKANITQLSNDRLEQVALVKASKIAYSQGMREAQKYLESLNLKWTIDLPLSTPDSLVLVNPEGKVKVAYRGTEILNPEDIISDASIAKGVDRELPQYRRAQEQLRSTLLKYGKPQELVGFSLGGNRAISFSNEFKIPARVFNPYIFGKVLGENNELVSVTRTIDDIVSLGVGVTKIKNIEMINPLRDNINPIASHTLDNFESQGPRAMSEDYRQPLKATGIATGLIAGYLGEKTVNALEKKTRKKLNPDIHAGVSGGLGALYTLPFSGGALLPVVSSGAIAGYTASKVSRENIGTSNPAARGAVSGATAAGVGFATLLLGDAYYGAEIGSLFGPAGLIVGTALGGLIGAASSFIP